MCEDQSLISWATNCSSNFPELHERRHLWSRFLERTFAVQNYLNGLSTIIITHKNWLLYNYFIFDNCKSPELLVTSIITCPIETKPMFCHCFSNLLGIQFHSGYFRRFELAGDILSCQCGLHVDHGKWETCTRCSTARRFANGNLWFIGNLDQKENFCSLLYRDTQTAHSCPRIPAGNYLLYDASYHDIVS